jgi:hypothetical protein
VFFYGLDKMIAINTFIFLIFFVLVIFFFIFKVSNLLLETVHGAIDSAVKSQLKTAVGKFNQSITTMIKEL